MKYVLPSSIRGHCRSRRYILSFVLAWILAQLPKVPRTIMALILYSPSMTSGVAMTVMWLTCSAVTKTAI